MIEFIITIGLICLGFWCGRATERSHYRSIKKREAKYLHMPAVSFKTCPSTQAVKESKLAIGSVVVSVDYFKRVMTVFRMVFGGELQSYAPLIDRGRREALLRMKESVPDADLFLNTRLETSTISAGQGNSVGTIEVVAYGTAIKFEKDEVRP